MMVERGLALQLKNAFFVWALDIFLCTTMAKFAPRIKGDQRELGLGRHISTQGRLINADGSFNVIRHSSSFWDNAYYDLVTMSNWRFFLMIFFTFSTINALFASLYLLGGMDQLSGTPHDSYFAAWMHAFFFSSQTITTVGYGHISPTSFSASLLASLESFFGLLFFALISGLLYGRFSRPVAKVLFSQNALISPFQNGTAFMFRMVNPRRSELVEAEVEVSLAINQRDEETGEIARRFFRLDLEINRIAFFSMSWTIVHAINANSPLYGLTEEQLMDANAEFLILLKGTDESNEQMVHARKSYVSAEVVWNAKFSPMMSRTKDQIKMEVHSHKVGEYEYLN
jgi:inward rectifier potassium channel